MIKLTNLSKSYGSKILLNDISYHMPEGEKIALIGNNGSGKTTLLRILLKQEEQDLGSITKPTRISIGSLQQEANSSPKRSIIEEALEGAVKLSKIKKNLELLTQKLHESSDPKIIEEYAHVESQYKHEGGYSLRSKTESILMGLGFTKGQMESSPLSLSGGWAMRLEMAKMLINDPNFMILDEPTNHLDLPSLIWFENYLQSYKGTLLFVSHDKDLLNRLSTTTLHLHKGSLRAYPGNYDNYIKQREERELHERNQIANLEKKKAQLSQFITRFGAKATKAKQAKSKEKSVDKITDAIHQISSGQTEGSKAIVIQLPPPPPCDRVVYTIEDGSIGYKEELFTHINLRVERSQKIAVIGANGIGKSTLLKSIAREIEPLSGTFTGSKRNSIAYFSQNLVDNLPKKKDLVSVVLDNSDITYNEARSLLGALLFTTEDLDKKIEVLSGGEKNRLALACVLAKKANFILLDEPTNHLDIESANALVEAFKSYEGTVIFVSHNRFFINAISSHIFALSRTKKTELFEGKLSDYERLAAVSGFPNVLEENTQDKTKKTTEANGKTYSYEERKQITREASRLEKKLASYDEKIEKLSEEQQKLEHELEVYSQKNDHTKLIEIQQELDDISLKKETLEEAWIACSEDYEAIQIKIREIS